jgi:hypothetical protein
MNNKEHTMNTPKAPQPNLVQDRKTGKFYDPKQAFDQLMNKPEILASLQRLKIR